VFLLFYLVFTDLLEYSGFVVLYISAVS